jgi:hypothetical protein
MAKEDSNINLVESKTDATTFISSGKGESGGGIDSTYNDFFQETSDGNISIGPRAQKSGLEILTTVLGYLIPITIIVVLAWAFHVYIQKWGWATAIKENYTFLCRYLNYSVTNLSEEHKCDPLSVIEASYSKKLWDLQNNIIIRLNEYIPIKLTKNILLTSAERRFAIETYNSKIHMDVIMKKFEEVIDNSKSLIWPNIVCNGISIDGKWNLTTQCTIYGSASGNDDENGKLWSARIETLRFLSNLSDTSKSQFILLNPPTSLSMEKASDREAWNFETSTTISIEATFVPFNTNEKL